MNNIKKITLKNNVKIIKTDEEKYVIKKSHKNLDKLFSYLKTRNFNEYPNIIEKKENEYIYEYIEDEYMPEEQKNKDIVKLMSSLHNKTVFYKEVGKDKYDEIYDKLKNNIYYIKEYYENLIEEIENEIYPSPSHFLIAKHYSKINSAIDFCKNEIEEWKNLVKDKDKQRVCVVHNNLRTSHFLKNTDSFFISWDNYIIDTPIWDLYNFYIKNNINNFNELLDEYEKDLKLSEDEKKLLFIMLSIPKKFTFELDEMESTNKVKEFIKHLYKSNDLILPYYSVNDENKTED